MSITNTFAEEQFLLHLTHFIVVTLGLCGEAASMRFCVGLHSSLFCLYDACKADGEMATVELMISQLSVPLML